MLGAALVVLPGLTALVFRPVAPRPPADVVVVELLRTDRWAVVLLANRDITLRRIAWVDSGVAPCKGGIAALTVDRVPRMGHDTLLSPGQRAEVAFPRGNPPWPFAEGPTGIDIEEVHPEGMTCQRISLTGPSPSDQWRLDDYRWAITTELGAGTATTPTGISKPIHLGWFADWSAGVGWWTGPWRPDASVLFGLVGCTGCADDHPLFRLGVSAGVTRVVWQGREHALEIGAAYRRTVAAGGSTTLWFNSGRLAVTWGGIPPPIVGVHWASPQTGLLGVEVFGEWLAPTDDRIGPQLMVGAGFKLDAIAF